MPTGEFIPTGKTSLIKTGTGKLQLQTEYACHPHPRITTTVSVSGQVVHKIERKLDSPVQSFEEQQRTENTMKHQHAEVEAVIRETDTSEPSPEAASIPTAEDSQTCNQAQPTEPKKESEEEMLIEKLRAIPGVEHVFHMDNDGNFFGRHSEGQFKNAYSVIFKNLRELMDVFTQLPGADLRREQGVYEAERDRLYYVSTGDDCYFMSVIREDGTNFETAINEVIFDFQTGRIAD